MADELVPTGCASDLASRGGWKGSPSPKSSRRMHQRIINTVTRMEAVGG